jgi:hypothetical protein
VFSDPLHGYTVEQLMDDRPQPWPDVEAHRRWLEGRRYVQRLADAHFDPREVLGMPAAEYRRWADDRLMWLKQTIDGGRQ